MSGLGHSSFYTHEECSFGRLFVGRSRTGHSIRLWRGCSPWLHRADMHTAPSLYWFHHNLIATPGNSVCSKDYVRVLSLPTSTAVERAGKLGVVNQALSLILCPVLNQFAVSVGRSIAPCRTKDVEVPNDHLLLVSYRSQWLMERETFTWWFVD